MTTTKQVFRERLGDIEIEHLVYKGYKILITQGNDKIVLTLDNLKSILKVAKRNLKEGGKL